MNIMTATSEEKEEEFIKTIAELAIVLRNLEVYLKMPLEQSHSALEYDLKRVRTKLVRLPMMYGLALGDIAILREELAKLKTKV